MGSKSFNAIIGPRFILSKFVSTLAPEPVDHSKIPSIMFKEVHTLHLAVTSNLVQWSSFSRIYKYYG